MAGRKLAILAVSIGVAAVLATACTDDPNRDLNGDQAPTSTHSASRSAASGPPASGSPSASVRKVRTMRRDAVLRAADVRGEGVTTAQARRSALSGCLAAAAGRDRAEPAASWRYPTGSKLYQYVFRGRLPAPNCGTPLRGVVDRGSDHSTAWCTHTGCGVAFAEQNTVSAVWVATPRRDHAAEAVRRLAPVVAERLNAD